MTSIEENIAKEFGKGVMVGGQSIVDRKLQIIPWSPKADICLSGGILEGTFIIFTGPPKGGKTIGALDIAASAQNIKYACDIGQKEGRHVYYFNIEGRLKSRDLAGIRHLNVDESRFTVIKSSPGNILTAEQFMDISEKLINEKPGDIFIIDSFSALCTKGRRDADIGDRFRDDTPLLLGTWCKRIGNVIPINKSIVIGITHLIANQGAGHAIWSEASGRKIQYQVDIKLRITHFTPWKVGEEQIGQDVHWECMTSAIGAPGGKFTSKYRYGYGIDDMAEVVELGVDLGLIQKGGAWFEFPDGKKAQGIEKARDYLSSDKKMYDELYGQIREMMGLENASC